MSKAKAETRKPWTRRTCGRCQHRDAKSGWCNVTAKWVATLAPCCDFGNRLIQAEQNCEAQRRFRGKAADGSDLKQTQKRRAVKVETKLAGRESHADAMTRHLRKNGGYFGDVPRKVRGNAAKIREAYEFAEEFLRDYGTDWKLHNKLCDMLKSALAAPARNCDVPHKDDHELWLRWQAFCAEIYPSRMSFSTWLLDLAQEGGAK